MPNEVLNTKHPGTESIKAICNWSNAKFISKQNGGSTAFVFRLSFSPAFIGQTWVLVGGSERYTGTVKATPDDVRVIGIDDNSEAIRYTLTTQTIGGEEVTRIIQLNKIGNYYPFGLHAKRILPIDIVPWSSGTDAQIATIINALESDYLTTEDTNWQVGDTRIVTIGAMENTDGEGNTIVSETHAEQQITRVLGHIGSPSGISRVDGGNIHFIVLQGCALAEGGYINSKNSKVFWEGCSRRTWCNSIYYNAINEIERAWYKKMIITTGVSDAENINTEDWFALPAEKEYVGDYADYQYSYDAEYDFLEQFSYYDDINNRKIKRGINGVANFTWTRSLVKSANGYSMISKDGKNYTNGFTNLLGLNPFGCI